MMRRLMMTVIVVSSLAVPAAPLLGDMQVTVTRDDNYRLGSGGEFTLEPNAELAAKIVVGTFSDDFAGKFQSFCVETTESVGTAGQTYSTEIATYSVKGGAGGQDGIYGPDNSVGIDSLDPRTAYLYSRFRLGTLSSYDYTPGAGRKASAGALQDAIWAIEDEIGVGSLSGQALTWYNEATLASPTGIGNVRVLNMFAGTSRTTGYRQDMLVLIPAPGAVLLGGLGLGLVGWVRRRCV